MEGTSCASQEKQFLFLECVTGIGNVLMEAMRLAVTEQAVSTV